MEASEKAPAETTEGMNELERRKAERATAREQRRGTRDSITPAAGSSEAAAPKPEVEDQAPAAAAPAPKKSAFSNMTENERQRRYDAKMADMDTQHGDSLDKRGTAPPVVAPTQEGVREAKR
jgi:hypothetical protein